MPRFTETAAASLKHKMLARAPDFMLSHDDVVQVVRETGLNKDQVQMWAKMFRLRHASGPPAEAIAYLRGEKVAKSCKVSRYYVTCFNVDKSFAAAFTLPKSKGAGNFEIKYMIAGFDNHAESGEFFIEFHENVWEHKLAERFSALGACQVDTITFEKDGGDSAASALVRVVMTQSRTALGYTYGTCPPQLVHKMHLKLQEEENAMSKEINDKTAAAIKQSLEECKNSINRQDGKLEMIESGVQSQVVKLEGIESQVVKLEGIESQVVKLEGIESGVQSQAENLVDIKHGVCCVIPDYQRDNALLREALAKKTAACDSIEGRLAHKTSIMKKQDAYIAKLEQDITAHVAKLEQDATLFKAKEKSWAEQEASYMQKNALLQEQLNLTSYLMQMTGCLRQMLERAQHSAEILSATLAEERAAKRGRV